MTPFSRQNVLTFCLIFAILLTLFTLSTPVLAFDDVVVENPWQESIRGVSLRSSPDTAVYMSPTDTTYFGKDGSWIYDGRPPVSGAFYAFAVRSSGSTYFFYVATDAQGTSYQLEYTAANTPDADPSITRSYSLSQYDSTSSLFYASNAYTLTELALPVFATAADGFASVRYLIDNGFTAPATSLSYSLPPGNVAYIPIASGQSSSISYTLTTTYYMAFGNNDTSRINQVVTVMSALPSSTNNLAPSSPKIPWSNNGNVNLLGVSANKIYQGSIPANYGGQYLVVVNPMTMPSQSGLIGGDTYTNGSINISVSAVSGSPHIYPMSESLTITSGDGIGSESTYGDTGYTYDIDPNTGEIIWTDPNGGSSAPVAGGNNPMPSPNTIFDWLRNISQQFSDFLRGPVQAVQVVVSAIRDFMGSFTQLYEWLPGPVYSLITSALMIALTIGVIKIFV